MVDDDRTHYEVLGVEPGAGKDDIRAAYQERLDRVQGERTSEAASKRPNEATINETRDEEAKVRSAWGVLSDPYQRGRYDANVGVPDDSSPADRDDALTDDDHNGNGASVARRRERPQARERRPRPPARERPPGLFSTQPLPTPASWPPGAHPPPPRARVLAMMLDVFVLAAMFIALTIAATSVAGSVYPKETKQLDKITTCLDRLNKENDRSKPVKQSIADAESYCQSTAKVKLASTEKRNGQKLQTRMDDDISKAEDTQTNLQTKRAPITTYAATGGILLLAMLYLVPSSIVSGRTLGKRLLQIHAMQLDGSPLGFRSAVVRYALPLTFALMLAGFLGPLAFAFALIGVLMWPRNPNLQGLHDRVARTIVVDG